MSLLSPRDRRLEDPSVDRACSLSPSSAVLQFTPRSPATIEDEDVRLFRQLRARCPHGATAVVNIIKRLLAQVVGLVVLGLY